MIFSERLIADLKQAIIEGDNRKVYELALILAERHLELLGQALRLERVVHDLVKEEE